MQEAIKLFFAALVFHPYFAASTGLYQNCRKGRFGSSLVEAEILKSRLLWVVAAASRNGNVPRYFSATWWRVFGFRIDCFFFVSTSGCRFSLSAKPEVELCEVHDLPRVLQSVI